MLDFDVSLKTFKIKQIRTPLLQPRRILAMPTYYWVDSKSDYSPLKIVPGGRHQNGTTMYLGMREHSGQVIIILSMTMNSEWRRKYCHRFPFSKLLSLLWFICK